MVNKNAHSPILHQIEEWKHSIDCTAAAHDIKTIINEAIMDGWDDIKIEQLKSMQQQLESTPLNMDNIDHILEQAMYAIDDNHRKSTDPCITAINKNALH